MNHEEAQQEMGEPKSLEDYARSWPESEWPGLLGLTAEELEAERLAFLKQDRERWEFVSPFMAAVHETFERKTWAALEEAFSDG